MLNANISCLPHCILFRIKSLQQFWFLISLNLGDETSILACFCIQSCSQECCFFLKNIFFPPTTLLLSPPLLEMQCHCMNRNQIIVCCTLIFNGCEGKIYHCFYNSLYKSSWNKKALSSTSSVESNVSMFCCFSSNRIYEALNVVRLYWNNIKGFRDFVFHSWCKGPSWLWSKGL